MDKKRNEKKEIKYILHEFLSKDSLLLH